MFKKMFTKNWKCVVVLSALALCLTSVQAQAVLVNVDINKASTFSGSTATSWSPTFDGDAVVNPGVTSQTWNALNQPNTSNPSTGSVPVLVDSEGNASSVTLPAFSLPNSDFRDNTGAVPDNGYNDLMGDRATYDASVTISGLEAGPWDLYVFGWAGATWQVTDGASPTVSQVWFPSTYDGSDAQLNASAMIDGTTYTHFSGTHVAGTDLVLTHVAGGGAENGHGQVRFTGFQIYQVPEPATLMLIAVGVPFLLKRRRNA